MALYRLPFAETDFSGLMNNGNWDDAGIGHGAGQPFAWDFGAAALPGQDPLDPLYVGHNVLAVRAGTIIDGRHNFNGWTDINGIWRGPNLNGHGQEEQTLTITTAATGTTSATVRLDGVDVTVPMTGATGSKANTAQAIASFNYGDYGWYTQYTSGASTVKFVALAAGNKTGVFSLTHASATGTFAETKAGSPAIDINGYNAFWKWGPGNYLIIQHADHSIAAYNHMAFQSPAPVVVGQYVTQGTVIGKVGNTGTSSAAHLHFECHVWDRPGSSGPGTVVNDTIGASLFIRFDDRDHPGWRPAEGDPFDPLATMSRQDGWRCCVRCAGLYFSYPGVADACPAPGGGHHAFAEGRNYVLANNAVSPPGQSGWKSCRKCAGLFFPNSGSKCPVTTPSDTHDATGSGAYSVIMNVPSDPGQHGWRYCGLCKGIFNSNASPSYCPGNPPQPFYHGPHVAGSTSDYSIEASLQDVQRKWRKCKRCRSLWLSTNGRGVCPAGAGGHAAGASDGHLLIDDVSPMSGSDFVGWQGSWRYCRNCGVLWRPGGSSVCPASAGGHVLTGSGEYWLHRNSTVPVASPQPDPGTLAWYQCTQCAALFSQGGTSVCAANGGAHTASSAELSLIQDYHLWHWCDKCQGLWAPNGEGGGTGHCAGDATPSNGHSQDESRDYYLVSNTDPAWPSSQAPSGYQNGWRRCTKCYLLHFGAAATKKCPKDGGAHTSPAVPTLGDWSTGYFALRHHGGTNVADLPGRQAGWRFCQSCSGLWLSLNAGSNCTGNSGGPHVTTGSGYYTLDIDIV